MGKCEKALIIFQLLIFRYLLGDLHFLEKLIEYDVVNSEESRFVKLRSKYFEMENFNKENILKNSEAAANIFEWIKAIDDYQIVNILN